MLQDKGLQYPLKLSLKLHKQAGMFGDTISNEQGSSSCASSLKSMPDALVSTVREIWCCSQAEHFDGAHD